MMPATRKTFARNREGATALEFAMLAPIFIVFLLTSIDYGVYYFANSQFETAVFKAQSALATSTARPTSAAAVKTIICGYATMISCSTPGFFVEVGPLNATQPAASLPAADSFNLSVGSPSMIRAVYPWGNLLPVAVFQNLGVPMSINSIEAGVFFYPTN